MVLYRTNSIFRYLKAKVLQHLFLIVSLSKALTKQYGPNICCDAWFFELESVACHKKDCENPASQKLFGSSYFFMALVVWNMFSPFCLHKIVLNQSEIQTNSFQNGMDCQCIINTGNIFLYFGLIENEIPIKDGFTGKKLSLL